MSWKLSENIFGSPGISNLGFYRYHNPSGKDVLLDGRKEISVPFTSSSDLYFDPDGHQLAAVTVTSVSGPGEIWVEGAQLTEGGTYSPTNFQYYPAEDKEDSITILNYKFIDYSGGESLEHSVVFMNLSSAMTPAVIENVNIFPVPSDDYCYIQIPGEDRGKAVIRIFDIIGNHIHTEAFLADQSLIELSLSGFRNGMYVLVLQLGEKVYTGKLLVHKK